MTYCLGIKVKSGLVALADTCITSGTRTTTSRKITTHQIGKNSLFIMTSGLRSVRDKAVTYFEEAISQETFQYDKMYKAVNAFGAQLRRVADEDKSALAQSGLFFNLHSIVGGQLEGDSTHKLFLLYPEGNWIEIGEATPFTIIGNTGYGQPILNRAITYQSDLKFALKTGFLSFDSTRVSANDVEYPIDVVIYKEGSYKMVEQRFTHEELKDLAVTWAQKLRENVENLNDDWMDKLDI
ncbi:peptidase [Reichenbachiella carrageenanivorans]|uniref:Peptidase n=1 Tax=Reichenbachiella carrageenanivorans TaxID=2979869 RepID=A0ABY6CXJ0_9BACT|nr:peptidase [Reichenbachiella carrageenanivorans]UXX78625.1 peptidase [Reichenbachiella carrageenanivorans]